MKTLFVTVILLLVFSNARSQAGTLDSSFGNNGIVYCETQYDYEHAPLHSIMDAQGRILTVSRADNDSGFFLIRHLITGLRDTSFGSNGQVLVNAGHISYDAILFIQGDSSILVASTIQHLPDTNWNLSELSILRLLPDGSPDISFGNQGTTIIDFDQGEWVGGIAVQQDGKMIVSGRTGWSIWGGGNTDPVLIRLLANGMPDSSFGIAGTMVTALSPSFSNGGPVAILPDGKILQTVSGSTLALLRFESNGTPDTSFGNDGIHVDSIVPSPIGISDMALLEDHSFLTAGVEGDCFGGLCPYGALRKFIPNGFADAAFADQGLAAINGESFEGAALYSIKIQSDNKIIATGIKSHELLLARFTPEGIPDSAYAKEGISVIAEINDWGWKPVEVYLYPDDKVTVVGMVYNPYNQEIDSSKVFIARFHNVGDNTATNDPNANPHVVSVYPNPSNDYITFDLSKAALSHSEIFIYNSGGILLKRVSALYSAQLRIPVDEIGSDGMYFYTMRTNDQPFLAGKFIIQR